MAIGTPESIVLGSRSYAAQSNDERRQLIQLVGTLSRPTIFVGCSQSGLNDPDFARLREFLVTWQDSAPRRYWLLPRKDPAAAWPSPDQVGRLYPVPAGTSYTDLPSFLSSVRSSAKSISTPVACIDLFEPLPFIVGRQKEIGQLVEALNSSTTAVVAGGPGMGKTATAIAAIYDTTVRERFGERRILVSLETASESDAILTKLTTALGLAPDGDAGTLLRLVENHLANNPVAAIFDNAETVLDLDHDSSLRILRQLSNIDGLAAIITVRGAPLAIPGATIIEDIPQLSEQDAREAFLYHAGESLRSDPHLPNLLAALDGHALSIILVGARAAGTPSLEPLIEAWHEAHADILRAVGPSENRLTSVRASLAVSLGSKRIREIQLAKRLLSVLAQLPAGLPSQDVRHILGHLGEISRVQAADTIACLHQLRLVERRLDQRLRILNPVRECIKLDLPITVSDRRRLLARYLKIAISARHAGWTRWQDVQQQIEAEADNLDPICRLATAVPSLNSELNRALEGAVQLYKMKRIGGISTLEFVISKERQRPPTEQFARHLHLRAHADLVSGRLDAAEELLREAIAIWRRFRNYQSEANSKYLLSEIELLRGRNAEAYPLIAESLAIYTQRQEKLGQANCTVSLGEIAKRRSRMTEAISRYREAQELYRSVPDPLGEANCRLRVAESHVEAMDLERIDDELIDARRVYESIGVTLGMLHCDGVLARNSLLCGDIVTAWNLLSHTNTQFNRLGIVVEEANSTFGLGMVAFRRQQFLDAYSRFSSAERLYDAAKNTQGVARAAVWCGRSTLGHTNGEEGRADIRRGFDLYFSIADPQDLAEPAWRAVARALCEREPVVAQRDWSAAHEVLTALNLRATAAEWIV